MVDLTVLGELCGEFVVVAKEEKKKHDPKAAVRNRGKVIFPAGSKLVSDDKDHFPIGSIDQARNALARSHQYSSNPSWHKGTLSSLQETVRRKVKSEYPSIDVTPKKKKSAMTEAADKLRTKLAEVQQTEQLAMEMNKALAPYGYVVSPGSEVTILPETNEVAVSVRALPNAKFKSGNQANQIAQVLAPLTPGRKVVPTISIG